LPWKIGHLATFIQVKPDLKLVGEARDGQQAVRLCEQLEPDVILIDLCCPAAAA
jgi:chemotaxis response regulator CheB